MTTLSTAVATANRSTHLRTEISSGFLLLALSLLVLSGCASQQQKGTIIGGITGGLIGSVIGDGSGQNVAIAAGAIAGSLIGSSIGQRFDEQDQGRIAYSPERNQRSSWTNATTGHRYTVFRTTSAFILIGASITGPLSAAATESYFLSADIQAVATEPTDRFEDELRLEIAETIRPPTALRVNLVVATVQMGDVEQQDQLMSSNTANLSRGADTWVRPHFI